MSRAAYWIVAVFILWPFHGNTQTPGSSEIFDFPEVPRVSAYEAYVKFKAGKAILLFGGGERYEGRHIMGSHNLDVEDKLKDKILLKFPREGIDLFTYCY